MNRDTDTEVKSNEYTSKYNKYISRVESMTCKSVTCRHYPAYKQWIYAIGEPCPLKCYNCIRAEPKPDNFEPGDPTAKREF